MSELITKTEAIKALIAAYPLLKEEKLREVIEEIPEADDSAIGKYCLEKGYALVDAPLFIQMKKSVRWI